MSFPFFHIAQNKLFFGTSREKFLLDDNNINIFGADNLGDVRVLEYGMRAVVGEDFQAVRIKAYFSLQRFSPVILHLLCELFIPGGTIQEEGHYKAYDTYQHKNEA